MDENKVLEAMTQSGEPMKTGDIAKILGVESKVVSAAIKKLRADGKVDSPKRCYYQARKG